MNKLEKEKEMEKIKKEIQLCSKCPLSQSRTNPVVGEGNLSATVMFIGEAPGFNEDQTGHPFCGAAGKVLDELLQSVNLLRKDIYITNILKCRPPQNRDPLPEEIKACAPYLNKQIEIIQPKIICSLGNYATKFILEKYGLKEQIQGISKIHGKIFTINTLWNNLFIVPLYHPAVATYNPLMKKILLQDFQIIKKILS